MRSYTVGEYARRLVSEGWSDGQAHPLELGPGRRITVDLTMLDADDKRLARLALNEWSAISSIRFVEDDRDAQITYRRPGLVSETRWDLDFWGNVESAEIRIGSPFDYPGDDIGDYIFLTYLHETGHALGLTHPQDYNLVSRVGQGDIRNDSRQISVMSYFNQDENPFIDAEFAYPVTPMPADIAAMRMLYGDAPAIHAGNTVYGVGSTAGGALDHAVRLGPEVAMTIADGSGIDMIDFRNATENQKIDLRPGAVSDVMGAKGNLQITAGTLIERATGGAGDDHLLGNRATNVLTGNAGRDRLAGGGGDDLYISDGRDSIIEGWDAGTDTVRSTASMRLSAHVENLELLGGAATGIGNSLSNRLIGNHASNRLQGGGGDDTMFGGTGNDVFHVDGQDRTAEAADAGIDTVISSAYHSLQANVEKLVLSGRAAISGVGNALDNRIAGNDADNVLAGRGGDDVLNGGLGRDVLKGGAGNDTYYINGGDRIVETPGGGNDKVVSTASYAMHGNIERLFLTGNAGINARGTDGDEQIHGNGSANALNGGGGNDLLSGRGGDDLLIGGPGRDVLVGGAGADTFVLGAGGDIIRDFTDDVDTIRVNAALLGGERNADEIVPEFVMDGNLARLWLPAGKLVMTVAGVGSAADLADDLIIV